MALYGLTGEKTDGGGPRPPRRPGVLLTLQLYPTVSRLPVQARTSLRTHVPTRRAHRSHGLLTRGHKPLSFSTAYLHAGSLRIRDPLRVRTSTAWRRGLSCGCSRNGRDHHESKQHSHCAISHICILICE